MRTLDPILWTSTFYNSEFLCIFIDLGALPLLVLHATIGFYILIRHGVSFHSYAEDTKIYTPIERNDPSASISLLLC